MKNNKSKIILFLSICIVIAICVLSVITLNQKNLDNSKKSTVKQDLTIITPSGAPALSLLGAINNQDINLNYEVVDGSDVLTAEFTNAEKDMIIAPVNLGVKLIEKGADYKLLGVVTWGNLYIVSSQNLYTSIAAFGEAAVPGKVLNYVKDLIGPNVNIEYYSSVQEAASMLLSGNTNAALLAEPVLTKTAASFKENNPDNSLNTVFNIQELYKEKTGLNSYPQAAIFVKNDSIENKTNEVLEFVTAINSSIDTYNNNPNTLLDLKDKVSFESLGFANVDLLVKAYDKMAIDYVFGSECTEEIKNFLELFNIEFNNNQFVK